MADTEGKKENQETNAEKTKEVKPAAKKLGMVVWLIMGVIVIVCAGSGFVLGRLFAGNKAPVKEEPVKQEEVKAETTPENTKGGSEKTWYYNDLESIVVNPDEPGATRFVRVGLILEMNPELSEEKAKELIGTKKPLLINWVNLYFKSLTLDQMRNDKDMKRIQLQILDAFNEILFSNNKPQIKRVLIKEFNIQ